MKPKVIYDLLIFGIILALLLFLGIPYLDLLIAFILILIYTYKKKGIKEELGFSKPESWIKTVMLSFLLGIGIVLLSYYVFLPQIQHLTGHPLELGMFEPLKHNTSLLISSLALGWIVGGLIEETIFRGFIISKFMDHLPAQTGAIIGIVFSSCLFGYLHTYQGPTGQILTGLVGFILAIIYVVNKRNIWLNIFTHGFVNTVSMLLLYFDLITP